ncbi:unnamed protein product, partial [Ectocarpus sp. 6 AP-2014]
PDTYTTHDARITPHPAELGDDLRDAPRFPFKRRGATAGRQKFSKTHPHVPSEGIALGGSAPQNRSCRHPHPSIAEASTSTPHHRVGGLFGTAAWRGRSGNISKPQHRRGVQLSEVEVVKVHLVGALLVIALPAAAAAAGSSTVSHLPLL